MIHWCRLHDLQHGVIDARYGSVLPDRACYLLLLHSPEMNAFKSGRMMGIAQVLISLVLYLCYLLVVFLVPHWFWWESTLCIGLFKAKWCTCLGKLWWINIKPLLWSMLICFQIWIFCMVMCRVRERERERERESEISWVLKPKSYPYPLKS